MCLSRSIFYYWTIFLFLLLNPVSSFCGQTGSGEWSFHEHPHSYEDTLNIWSDRVEKIANERFGTVCRAYEEIAYAKYQELYPEFAPHADQANMRDGWIISAIMNSMDTNCYFDNLFMSVKFSAVYADAVGICGNFSRQPRDEIEVQSVRSVLVLAQIANAGHPRAIHELLNLESAYSKNIRYHPIFFHYFWSLQESSGSKFKGSEYFRDGRENAALLHADTIHEIEEAAQQHDLKKILHLLPACAPFPEKEISQ